MLELSDILDKLILVAEWGTERGPELENLDGFFIGEDNALMRSILADTFFVCLSPGYSVDILNGKIVSFNETNFIVHLESDYIALLEGWGDESYSLPILKLYPL